MSIAIIVINTIILANRKRLQLADSTIVITAIVTALAAVALIEKI